MKIGFVGIGHLGICHAVAASARGFEVVCYDPDAKNLIPEPIGRMVVPAGEPGLKQALPAVLGRMQFVARTEMLADCKAIFIARDVEVPQDEEPLYDIIDNLHLALPPDIPFVIVSQVAPGFTRNQANARHTRPFYYQLDPIICGQGYERCFSPERFVVGSKEQMPPLDTYYAFYLMGFGCPVYRMEYEEAEFSKLAINTMLAVQVAAANELAADALTYDASWARVAVALRTDARIGKAAYLRPGIIGGHLPRDIKRLQPGDLRAFLENHTNE